MNSEGHAIAWPYIEYFAVAGPCHGMTLIGQFDFSRLILHCFFEEVCLSYDVVS